MGFAQARQKTEAAPALEPPTDTVDLLLKHMGRHDSIAVLGLVDGRFLSVSFSWSSLLGTTWGWMFMDVPWSSMISHDVLTKQWHLGLPSDCSIRCRLAEQSRILPGGGVCCILCRGYDCHSSWLSRCWSPAKVFFFLKKNWCLEQPVIWLESFLESFTSAFREGKDSTTMRIYEGINWKLILKPWYLFFLACSVRPLAQIGFPAMSVCFGRLRQSLPWSTFAQSFASKSSKHRPAARTKPVKAVKSAPVIGTEVWLIHKSYTRVLVAFGCW